MKIKTLSGEVEISEIFSDDWKTKQRTVWVRWADIKPILEEYQAMIENTEQDMNFY